VQKIKFAMFALLALQMTTPCSASLSRETSSKWHGSWTDKKGGQFYLDQSGNVADFYGTDAQTIYRGMCVISRQPRNVATCTGDGINHVHGFRFTYRTELHLSGDGNLLEEWEATSGAGTVKGKAVFERTRASEPR